MTRVNRRKRNCRSKCSKLIMNKIRILDANVDNLELKEIIDRVKGFVQSGRPNMIITANSLMVNCISGDNRLKKVFDEAALVLADSVGIVWASKCLGEPALKRIPGIDLMIEICSLAARKNYSLYLLGAHNKIVEKAAEELRKKLPSLKIAGTHHGYFTGSANDERDVIREIKETRPDILFVGMDVPRQEKWLHEHMEELGVSVCMGIGGSFDVISGRFERAPLWVRRMGLEWAYRFLLQPWRITRLIKLPVFVYKVFRQKHSSVKLP